MSWLLRESPDAVAAAAARIEKDFSVTDVLRGVAQHSAATGVSAVFKGGTSLSKAFRLIKRFSEDVDIIVMVAGRSTGQVDRLLKGVVASAEGSTGLTSTVDSRTATKGVKRTVTLAYPTDAAHGPVRPGVPLELGTRGGAMPTMRRQVASLVVEHGPGPGPPLRPELGEVTVTGNRSGDFDPVLRRAPARPATAVPRPPVRASGEPSAAPTSTFVSFLALLPTGS